MSEMRLSDLLGIPPDKQRRMEEIDRRYGALDKEPMRLEDLYPPGQKPATPLMPDEIQKNNEDWAPILQRMFPSP